MLIPCGLFIHSGFRPEGLTEFRLLEETLFDEWSVVCALESLWVILYTGDHVV